MVDPFPPEPAHEWVTYRRCDPCEKTTEMFAIEWRDEPVVTFQCTVCDDVTAIEDLP